MNCDMAFELMTEPHGGRSLALHEHLRQCPRCRQMQETLAPALEWLMEAAQSPEEEHRSEPLGDSAASQLSAMPKFAMEGAVAIAQQAADALSIRCAPSKVRFRRWIAATVRSAALLAIGGFLA
ncbi:MAG TPA: hypothetical protein VL475_01015, partial [Planctomycetaceae bacterium]|nr:hypothetical protein [Planctomycetaceae bacterium]